MVLFGCFGLLGSSWSSCAVSVITPSIWPGQEVLFADNKTPEHAVVSGNNWGKTVFGTRWSHLKASLNQAAHNEYLKKRKKEPVPLYSLVGAHKWDILKNNNLGYYITWLQELGYTQSKPFPDFKVNTSGDMSITLFCLSGHKILFRTLEKSAAQTLEGFSFCCSWVDEAARTAEVTPIQITRRTRGPAHLPAIQRLYTGTPEGMKNWFAQKFAPVQEFRDGRFSKSEDGKILILHGRTEDNPYTSQDYLDSMRDQLSFDKNLIRAYLYGEFCPIFEFSGYDFNRQEHIRELKVDTRGPLYVGWDFNVGLVSWQVVREYEGNYYVTQENKQKARTTYEACQSFLNQFPPHIYKDREIIVYGDSSGYSRNTASYTTDYDIIKSQLKREYPFMKILARRSNPTVGMRLAVMNRLFSEDYHQTLYVSAKNTKLVESLTQTTIDAKGNIEKPASDTWTHPADALGYVMVELAPIIKPNVGAVNIPIGVN